MSRKLVAFGVLALLGLLAASSGETFAQVGFISGQVLDQDGKPVQAATIRIEGLTTARKYSLKTDKAGKYVHAGVSLQGTYRVIVEKEGFQGEYVQGVRPGFTRDDERAIVNFTLRPGDARKFDFEMTDEERARIKEQAEKQAQQAAQMEAIRETFNQGITYFNAGQYAEAADAFLKTIEKDNSQPAVWANLASAYAKMGKNQEALDAYQKAIELDSENPAYYQNQGSLYAEMGNGEKARELYEKAAGMSAAMNPADAALSYYNMGVTYINAGKNKEAAEALQKALEMDPNHAESHYQLGITMIGLGEMDEAIAQLKKYLELAPNSQNAEVAKALIEQLGGN